MYRIYGRDGCPFCAKAVALCEKRAFEYNFIKAHSNELPVKYNHFTLPLIMKDDEFVGGYSELHKSTGHHSALESTVWWVETLVFAVIKRDEFKTRMKARNDCHAATANRKK